MRIKGHEFTIGADPEFFVRGSEGNIIPALPFSSGTKRAPEDIGYGNKLQVDGMALELNVKPAPEYALFQKNLKTGLDFVEKRLAKGRFRECSIYKDSPVACFTEQQFNSVPKENRELGCDPDYNAYTGSLNPIPNGNVDFRTASGHIHVGWTKDVDPLEASHFEACKMLTKCMDIFVGLAAKSWELAVPNGDSFKRRELYGKAGAFRPKPYGMEYRVLDNFWIFDDRLIRCVFENTVEAIKFCFDSYDAVDAKTLEKVVTVINRDVPVEDNNQLVSWYLNGIFGRKIRVPIDY